MTDLRLRLEPQATALVKGSRFMRMERVVRALAEMPAAARRAGVALMLLELFEWLARDIRAFNVFSYLTLRAVLAAATALLLGLLSGPRVIRKLTELKIGQSVRNDGPQTHLVKTGTPTMGGALILISIGVTTLLWADLSNRFVWVVLIVTVGFGWIGWVDDYRKVVHRNPKGMSAKEKYFWQSLIGLGAAFYLAFAIAAPSTDKIWALMLQWVEQGFFIDLPPRSDLLVPFFKNVAYPLGVFGFALLSYLVIVGTSNAVNLTDGLDGLAIMPTVMIGAALGVFAYVVGRADFARYLLFPYIPGRRRARDHLRRDRRRGAGVPLVQRLSGRGLHGRRRRARARRRARHDRGDHAAGDRALHHGRRIRRRDRVGDDAGGLLQMDQGSPHLPHGAAAPPLRALGLEGDAGRRAVLDHHHDAGARRSVDTEDPMKATRVTKRRASLLDRSANPCASVVRYGRLLMSRALILGLGSSGPRDGALAASARMDGARGRHAARTRPARGAARATARTPSFAAGRLREDLLQDVESGRGVARAVADAAARSSAAEGGAQAQDRSARRARALRARTGAAEGRSGDYAPRVLGVTGTNGKTTTTRLAGLLVERCGQSVAVAGNIGPTALDALAARLDADSLPQVWVLELSSFQLATTTSLACDAATVLNVTQDHLDWHGSMDAYARAKERIFAPARCGS